MNTNTQAVPSHLADAPAEDRLAFAISEVARQFPDRTAIVAGAGGEASRTIDYATLATAITKLEADLDRMRPASSFVIAVASVA